MDTALSNGNFLLDSRGIPFLISGVKELLQRALIRLSIKKGSFIYDRDFGSNLYKLKGDTGNIQKSALNIVRETLSVMPEIFVENVSVRLSNSNEDLSLNILLYIKNKKEELEVII